MKIAEVRSRALKYAMYTLSENVHSLRVKMFAASTVYDKCCMKQPVVRSSHIISIIPSPRNQQNTTAYMSGMRYAKLFGLESKLFSLS